jgi:hypothetical protein
MSDERKQPADGDAVETIELSLTFATKCKGGEWTGLCLELDIASCAGSEDEVIKSLKGLIELYVADCLAEGEVAIPLRPVPLAALQDFLRPTSHQEPLSLTTRQESLRQKSPEQYVFS